MGSIFDANSYIDAVAFVEQSGDPTTVASRWLSYFKSDGMYQKSPAGTALRLLTTADIPGSGAAPANATYITQTANGTLTNEQALSLLSTGFMYVTTTTGVVSSVGETGTGNVVRATSPTITTPNIAKLANLTSNGFVITSGGDGTLSVVAAKQVLTSGRGNTLGAGLTRYFPFGYPDAFTTAAAAGTALPFAGTLKNLYIRTTSAQPGGGTLVLTVYLNGSATGITITVAAGAAAAQASDTTHTQAVAAGDNIALQVVNNDGGAASASISTFSLELDTVA